MSAPSLPIAYVGATDGAARGQARAMDGAPFRLRPPPAPAARSGWAPGRSRRGSRRAAIFTWYIVEGLTLYGLARRLIARGTPTPTGRPCWNPSSARKILTNSTYQGTA